MEQLFILIDALLFIGMLATVTYLLIFALSSLYSPESPTAAKSKMKMHRFAVLFPAYKEDKVIKQSVAAFHGQDYPAELYETVVIADRLRPDTVAELRAMGTTVLEVNYENSTKAKALCHAAQVLDSTKYDIVAIMDADNIAQSNFLSRVNEDFCAGIKAVQAHRTAKNTDTDTALLDAASEEINNSIFRQGHVRMGLSSALIGSGMAFDYGWFKENIESVTTAGEDKEFEKLLLKNGEYIHYLNEVYVYDQKTERESSFYNQRRRWLAAQFGIMLESIKDMPRAIADRNWDYADKLFQWIMLPRSINLLLMVFFSIVWLPFDWTYAIKWWILLGIMIVSMALALPDKMLSDKRMLGALKRLPRMSIMMLLNMFRLKGAYKKFIHTEH